MQLFCDSASRRIRTRKRVGAASNDAGVNLRVRNGVVRLEQSDAARPPQFRILSARGRWTRGVESEAHGEGIRCRRVVLNGRRELFGIGRNRRNVAVQVLQCVNRDPEMADSRVDFPIAGPKFAQLPNNGPNYLRDRSLRGTVGIICGCHSDKMIIDKFRCTYQTQGIEACSSGMDARNEVQILFSVVKRFANVHVYLTTRRQMVACDYVS